MAGNWEEKFNILVVDDHVENVDLLQELLTMSGYEVSTAYNGEEALQKAYETIPDLILLDIMMPEVDGYQVCKALRTTEKTKNIPIIFVTAKSEVEDWTHAIFNIGVNNYITKPIDPKKLLDKVKSVFRMKQSRDKLRKTREKLSKNITDSAPDGVTRNT
jgi:PleD family two-component response regulator